ncbi:MAG: hypothetical protein AAF471_08340, partial [Myxococcota bacterium]
GTTLASASDDSAVKLWRADDGTLLRTIKGHAGPVRSVAFSPDGSTLASASEDNTVKVIDVEWQPKIRWRVRWIGGRSPLWLDGADFRGATGLTDEWKKTIQKGGGITD